MLSKSLLDEIVLTNILLQVGFFNYSSTGTTNVLFSEVCAAVVMSYFQ